ncbi:unnamed protein product [Prunus brigantina]
MPIIEHVLKGTKEEQGLYKHSFDQQKKKKNHINIPVLRQESSEKNKNKTKNSKRCTSSFIYKFQNLNMTILRLHYVIPMPMLLLQRPSMYIVRPGYYYPSV